MGRWHETVAKRKFSMEIVGSIARNVRFGSFVLGNLKEASHETFVLEACSVKFGASHETIVLEAFSVKIVGSIARNDHFGSLFCEIWRKPRTKRSFWKLFLLKLSEASHETIILEACSVKFGGSLARNDRFGSLFCENCRKHRTKRSFWKLVL